MMTDLDLTLLETRLGHRFHDPSLLEQALRHSSFVNEHPDKSLEDNERLEFLGDAVLNTVVSHLLMERFPGLNEGSLSKTRSNLVNESTLAGIAREVGLGAFIRLGRGEHNSGGREKASILADGFEALMAAVYLDGGFDRAFSVIRLHFCRLMKELAISEDNQDFKSRLQEITQAALKLQPEYQVVNEIGPDHDKTFEVAVTVGEVQAIGAGKSKKAAEQAAARKALESLAGII